MKLFKFAVFAGSVAAACGSSSGGDGDGDGAATENEGLFAIQSWTVDDGCDGGEVDVTLDNPALLGVGNQVIFGGAYVKVAACDDEGDCIDRVQPDYAGPIDATFLFGEGDDLDGYTGFTVTAASTIDGCEGRWADHSMTFDGSTLRIESDRTASIPMEPDADGFCTSTEAEAVARDAACAEREVIAATSDD
jgi:hypothetical protein